MNPVRDQFAARKNHMVSRVQAMIDKAGLVGEAYQNAQLALDAGSLFLDILIALIPDRKL